MELLIGGLGIGGIYALMGIGIVLIFRASGVLNFAQAELMMIGAYAYVLVSRVSDSAVLQMGAAMVAGGLAGLVCFAVTHVLLAKSSRIAQVIGTLALLIFFQSSARHIFTDDPRKAEVWLFGSRNVDIAGATVSLNSLLIIVTTVIATGALHWWQNETLHGKAVRAVAENEWRAALSGIHVRSTLAISWGIGGLLAGVAGVLVGPVTGVSPGMGNDIIFPAFIAGVIGGFGSILGVLAGGLILGLIETYAVVLFGGAVKEVAMFTILILLLLWRPTGLFATRQIRKA